MLPPASAPLAARMRPRTLDEYVGQHHVVGAGSTLRALLERDELCSVVLWGPPGSGKTSLAAVIAATTDAAWEELSAVSAGVKDVRAVIDRARTRLQAATPSDRARTRLQATTPSDRAGTRLQAATPSDGSRTGLQGATPNRRGRRTVLFLDEIHRFNKAQQDALLPAVEHGWFTLVGATTENPFFELTAPLLSRCQLVRLEPLDAEAISTIVRRAVTDPDRGYGGRVALDDDARHHLVAAADGDARVALVTLEAAVEAASADAADGVVSVTLDDVVAALASKRLRYDKDGDQHYDQASAFIKSLRGSDPDAAVYWLVRMLDAGEDPRFLARRMVIFASEDVGLADRGALGLSVAAFEALDRVGLPEARFNLVHAAIALATAPKSDSVKRALGAADAAVSEAGNAAVPPHLRDAHYRGARRLGHGVGYRSPHDYADAHVRQQYLPDELVGRVLYRPTEYGDEAQIARRVARWRSQATRSSADTTAPDDGRSGAS
ncbi:MAG: replication-associated recombination protein A [Actinomycetota bacterium]|nr:replication-associated recombination protein A [Actinomycetota bacterium]